jgi:hypothetical protein
MTLDTQTNLASVPLQATNLSAINKPRGIDGLNRGEDSYPFLMARQRQELSLHVISDKDQHLSKTKGSSIGIINPCAPLFSLMRNESP